MFSPTVTELPRSLESTARDTFIDVARRPVSTRPRPLAPHANVTQLRSAPARAAA